MTDNKENVVYTNIMPAKSVDQEIKSTHIRRPLVTLHSLDHSNDLNCEVTSKIHTTKRKTEYKSIKVYEDRNSKAEKSTSTASRQNLAQKTEQVIRTDNGHAVCLSGDCLKHTKVLRRPISGDSKQFSPGKEDLNYSSSSGRFRESFRNSLRPPDALDFVYRSCISKTYAKDIFRYLVSAEKIIPAEPKISSIVRSCIINWLVKINGADKEPSVVQTACWYFDSLLAAGPIPLDKLQLAGAACYWVAQKLLGPSVLASNLVRCSNYAFTRRCLFREEKIVLCKLNFPPSPVIVQDYLNYLCWWCERDSCGRGEALVAATFIYTCGLMTDKTLCQHWPSVSGAAAVETALVLLGQEDRIHILHRCPAYQLAQRKAGASIPEVKKFLLRAVSVVSTPCFSYRAPLEAFNFSPYCIAQKIVSAVNKI